MGRTMARDGLWMRLEATRDGARGRAMGVARTVADRTCTSKDKILSFYRA